MTSYGWLRSSGIVPEPTGPLAVKVVEAPTEEPITLAEAKAHLRVDGTDEDDLITALIVAAREWCEKWTRRAFMQQRVRATYRNWHDLWLPRPPFAEIQSVTYLDANEDEQTLAASVYRVLDNSDDAPARIVLALGQVWPDIACADDAVRITYWAGYQGSGSPSFAAAAVPDGIRLAIKQVIGDLFEHREARIDMQSYDNPTARALLAAYRTEWV